jgi:hypothetical protein
MYSFLRTAEWETSPLFYHFQPSGYQARIAIQWKPRGKELHRGVWRGLYLAPLAILIAKIKEPTVP